MASLQPPYADKNLVLQPGIVGTWDRDKSCTDAEVNELQVRELDAKNKLYELTVADLPSGWTSKYKLRFARLKDFVFVDATFEAMSRKSPESSVSSNDVPMVGAHFVTRIVVQGDHLQIAILDGDALQKAIESHQVNVQEQTLDELLILTGDTPAVEGFLAEIAGNKQFFHSTCDYTRRK